MIGVFILVAVLFVALVLLLKKLPAQFFLLGTMMTGEKRTLKERIQMIGKKQKTIWIVVALALIAILVAALLCFGGKQEPLPAETEAEQLYSLKTPYIGNPSAVGVLLSALNLQELGTYTLELETETEPYGVTLLFSELTADSAVAEAALYRAGALFLALVENAGSFSWQYAGPAGKVSGTLLDTQGPEGSYKPYGASVEKLQALLTLLAENPLPQEPLTPPVDPLPEEPAETETLTFSLEGTSEEVVAKRWQLGGASFLVPETGWQLVTESDLLLQFQPEVNDGVSFAVQSFPNATVEEVVAVMQQADSFGFPTDADAWSENSETGATSGTYRAGEQRFRVDIYAGDMICYAVVYSYPLEAAEGFGARMQQMSATLRVE